MKAEVQIPDDLFALTQQEMEMHGCSRDAVIADALRIYFEKARINWAEKSGDEITAVLNKLYEEHPELAGIDPLVEAVQLEVLRRVEW